MKKSYVIMKRMSEPVMLGIFIWTTFWRGIAAWRAAKSDQMYWFIAFFLLIPVNTIGIIEILYLVKFAKKRLTIDEIREWAQRKPRGKK